MLRNVLPKKQKRYYFLENGGSPRVPRNSTEGPRNLKDHYFWTSKRRRSFYKTFLKVSPRRQTYSTKILPKQKRFFQKKSHFFDPKTLLEIAIEEPGDLLGTLCARSLGPGKTCRMTIFSFYE